MVEVSASCVSKYFIESGGLLLFLEILAAWTSLLAFCDLSAGFVGCDEGLVIYARGGERSPGNVEFL